MGRILLPTFLVILLVVNRDPVRAGDDKPANVGAILQAKNFWDTTGKKDGRKWTEPEKTELENLKAKSKDRVVRLRANKVLVDLQGNGKLVGGAEAEAAAIGSFRHLEGMLPSIPVNILCFQEGFTHYISQKNGVFLIEHVEAKGFNGGLNLRWDFAKKEVTEMKSWGDVPSN